MLVLVGSQATLVLLVGINKDKGAEQVNYYARFLLAERSGVITSNERSVCADQTDVASEVNK